MPNWTEQSIALMIRNKVEESSSLDWKRSDALRPVGNKSRDAIINELSKDVSSFANAAGGVIVYGVEEEKQNPHRPVNFDNGFDPADLSKEWLDNVISSAIRPPLKGVEIFPVALSGVMVGRYVYVVEIQQSYTVHQARDCKYYRRRNFKADPMEDWEIREGMLRARIPVIDVQTTWNTLSTKRDLHTYSLSIVLENIGPVRARDLMFQLEFPVQILHSGPATINKDELLGVTVESKQIPPVRGVPYHRLILRTNESGFVLFPTLHVDLSEYGFLFSYKVDYEIYRTLLDLPIVWRVYADDALPRTGQLVLREIQCF